MANEEQLKILQQGADAWNKWRANIGFSGADLSEADLRMADLSRVDLSEANLNGAGLDGANLRGANLYNADLSEANLRGADLSKANLYNADLIAADLSEAYLIMAKLNEVNLSKACLYSANLNGANLSKANLDGANLSKADLIVASLSGADLSEAYLNEADLSGADLSRAYLNGAILIETNLERSTLTDCAVYGISAWGLKLHGAKQKDLIITPPDEPIITADNLEVAQFIYLLLHNEKIREVIDTITSKVVLILGRFTPERKAVLDAIRDELRSLGYLPVLFDFEKPASLGLTETVSTLAHMAKFIIADITDAKSIPHELAHIVPQLPSVPVQPLILSSDYEYALFNYCEINISNGPASGLNVTQPNGI
jgi:uncharacterized protein YjbI with pentapeptide repeats